MKRIKVHIRQHWTKYFCPCGLSRGSKDAVASHQRSMDGSTPTVARPDPYTRLTKRTTLLSVLNMAFHAANLEPAGLALVRTAG